MAEKNQPDDDEINMVLAASPDDYWEPIVTAIELAGREVRPAILLNHQAAHLLFWATIGRNAAIEARDNAGQLEQAEEILDRIDRELEALSEKADKLLDHFSIPRRTRG